MKKTTGNLARQRRPQSGAVCKAQCFKNPILKHQPVPNNHFSGLFIEFKVGHNKLSNNQTAFLKAVTAQKYATATIYDFDSFRLLISRYLNNVSHSVSQSLSPSLSVPEALSSQRPKAIVPKTLSLSLSVPPSLKSLSLSISKSLRLSLPQSPSSF